MIARDLTQLALVATKMATITTAEARKVSSLPASYLSFVSTFLRLYALIIKYLILQRKFEFITNAPNSI